MPMRVLFRVDASLLLASGHVMRCLTLARALVDMGAECRFVCRNLNGHMVEYIRMAGFNVQVLSSPREKMSSGVDPRVGVSEIADAIETIAAIGDWQLDWIVVDHYALALQWEQVMRRHCKRLMVIDDYTDRSHSCDILLNQNLGVSEANYGVDLLEQGCVLLMGTRYALLRPEFTCGRVAALARRGDTIAAKSIIVTMGGVDPQNITGRVLSALCGAPLPCDCDITVVMGGQAPHLSAVRAQVSLMPFKTRLVVDAADISRLMIQADIGIGAAGTTSWERCALGLPSVVMALAHNQIPLAQALEHSGAAIWIDKNDTGELLAALMRLIEDQGLWGDMAKAAAAVVDGKGSVRVVEAMSRLL